MEDVKAKFYEKEATYFVENHPDFFPTSANRDALFDRLAAKKLNMDRHTLKIVFEELKAEGKLELAPMVGAVNEHSTTN